jgi:anti-anti-sigma regulatory factor
MVNVHPSPPAAANVRLFQLPPELTIYTAEQTAGELLQLLQSAAADGVDLRVGAAAVEDIDGAGLQLVLALDRACRAQGVHWTLEHASARVQALTRQFGVSLPGLA